MKNLFLSHLKNRFNMKNIRFILILSTLIAVFNSCSTDVELYADYKDTAIVYAMLDPRADTNYIKITRAFSGTNDNPIDASELVMIADSCNYPGKLDARIIELKKTPGSPYTPTGRVIELDTITIHGKEDGVFYANDQLFYYTTERFNTGTAQSRYQYRLVVLKPRGDSLIAQTNIVGNKEFQLVTDEVYFKRQTTSKVKEILFRPDEEASIYEVTMQFNYHEQKVGQEMTMKNVSYSYGTKASWEFHLATGNLYSLEYPMNWLFDALEKAIGGDTIVNPNNPNVTRYIDDFVITISAGGDEFNIYYQANQTQMQNPTSLVYVYNDIEGGYGLFSSRTTLQKVVKISANTERDLFGMFSWGFKEYSFIK